MKLYLSSFKLGHQPEEIARLMPPINRKIGCVPNALDLSRVPQDARERYTSENMVSLRALGLKPEVLDLKNYFGRESELAQKLDQLGGVFVGGGNVFVLRQAMRLSGFDEVIARINARTDFLYAAYSAGACVLSPELTAYSIVDDSTDTPYEELKEVLWDGLGLIDYAFLPHYDSDHPESDDIAKEIHYCIDHKILFKALRDGEVIIRE